MTTTTVSTTAELLSALGSATAGDVVVLAPGRYDGTAFRWLDFDTPVTITSADPEDRAVFDQQVRIIESSGLHFEGIDFVSAAPMPSPWAPLLRLDGATDISFRDVLYRATLPNGENGTALSEYGTPEHGFGPIEGVPLGQGISVNHSSRITFEQIEVTDLNDAILLAFADDIRISHSHFHHMRSDGIKLSDVGNIVIEHSLFHSVQMHVPPNALSHSPHPDFIQAVALSNPRGIDGLVIRGNIFSRGDGDPGHTLLSGLTLYGPNAATVGFNNIEIYDNLIHSSHIWGLKATDMQGLEIHHNTFLPAPMDPTVYNTTGGYPAIAIGAGSPDPDYGDAPEDIHIHSNRLVGRNGDGVLWINDDVRQPPVNVVIEENEIYAIEEHRPDYWGNSFPDAVGVRVPSAAAARIGDGAAGVRSLDPWLIDWLNDPGDTLDFGLAGTDGPDVLQADDTGQELRGGGGPDMLSGGTGIDTLYGGPGDDLMQGGAGADVFSIRPGFDEEDRILDLSFAENDYVHLVTGFGRGFFNDATDPANPLPLAHDGSGAYITERADLIEIVAHEGVTATAAGPNSTTLGFDLDGNGTVDWQLRLDGITDIGEDRAAADPITGGPGGDLLIGSTGADRIAAGPGQDTLSGGEGADIFQLDPTIAANGADTISDLNFAAGDRLEFLSLGTEESVRLVESLEGLLSLQDTGLAQLREFAGHTDLLFDREGDGFAEWTVRLEGFGGAVEAPTFVDEIPAGAPDAPTPITELRIAQIDPIVLELMGDLG